MDRELLLGLQDWADAVTRWGNYMVKLVHFSLGLSTIAIILACISLVIEVVTKVVN